MRDTFTSTNAAIMVIGALIVILYVPVLVYFSWIDLQAFGDRGFPIGAGGDDVMYAVLARNLVEHGAFSLSQHPPWLPDGFRTPGYPLFVAFFLAIFKTYALVSVAQILLAGLTAAMVWAMTAAVASRRAAYMAAVLYVGDPLTMDLSIRLLSDTLFVFLVVAAVYVLFCARRNETLRGAWLGGVLLGTAVLVRPIGFFLPAGLACFCWAAHRGRGWRANLSFTAVLAVVCSLVLGPWLIRNRVQAGKWAISSVSGYNLLFCKVAYFLADRARLPVETVRAQLRKEVGSDDWFVLTSLSKSDVIERVALGHLKQHPLAYARYHIQATGTFFLASSASRFLSDARLLKAELARRHLVAEHPPDLSRLFRQGRYYQIWSAAASQPLLVVERAMRLLLAGLMCVAVAWPGRDPHLILKYLFLSLVLYFAMVTAPDPDIRFRLPAQPFICALAACGAGRLKEVV